MLTWKSLAVRISARLEGAEPALAASVVARLGHWLDPWLDGEVDHEECARRLGLARTLWESRHELYAYERRISTCFHEAGHAVVAVAVGADVRGLTCETDHADLSHGTMRYRFPRAHPDAREAEAIIALAGPLAELQAGFPHEASLDLHREHAGRAILARDPGLTPPERIALLSYCDVRARTLVSARWATISRVADALHAAGTLDAEAFARAYAPLTETAA